MGVVGFAIYAFVLYMFYRSMRTSPIPGQPGAIIDLPSPPGILPSPPGIQPVPVIPPTIMPPATPPSIPPGPSPSIPPTDIKPGGPGGPGPSPITPGDKPGESPSPVKPGGGGFPPPSPAPPSPTPPSPTPPSPTPPSPKPGTPDTPTKKTVYAFDIDKTLTSVKNTSSTPVENLIPNQEILKVAMDAKKAGNVVVIATARQSKYKERTLEWIKKIGLTPDLVLIRAPDDTSTDPEVKVSEMKTIQSKYPGQDIKMYDDKEENCAAVEKLKGVTCIRVVQK